MKKQGSLKKSRYEIKLKFLRGLKVFYIFYVDLITKTIMIL